MARRPSLAILIVVAGAFFLIGLYTAFLQEPPAAQGPATPRATEVSPTANAVGRERTTLFLGVDDLQAPQPELRAIWFLSFRPPGTDLFLLGVPIHQQAQGDPPQPLAESFELRAQNGPSDAFEEALFRTVPLEFDTVVVLDEVAFATAIDYVGGVRINDATFTGQEVLGILSLAADDPSGYLNLQRRLLDALAAQAPDLGVAPEITPLVELQPDHLYASKDLNQLVALISPLLPIRPETTHIELY